MILYLVLNVETPEERIILDICSDKNKAYELQDAYRKNFRIIAHYDNSEDIIIVEELDLDEFVDEEVIWSYDS